MTHDDDARVADLLARLGDGDTEGAVPPAAARHGMQELIDAELTAAIGAAPHERIETRSNQRNGSRSRLLSTPAGDVELRIPKVRVGSFFPSLLEPRRRVDRALWGVIMTAYMTGTCTRKVDDLVRALGCESGVSKSTVSRICAGIDEEVAVFRSRRLDHVGFPYCISTPPTSRPGSTTGSSPAPSSWPPASPSTVTARCSASMSATPRTRCSGPRSCAASRTVACSGVRLVDLRRPRRAEGLDRHGCSPAPAGSAARST